MQCEASKGWNTCWAQAIEVAAAKLADAIAEPAAGFPQPDSTAASAADEAAQQEMDDVACMAADWLGVLAEGPSGAGPVAAGVAGLAAALVVCCCTRCAPAASIS